MPKELVDSKQLISRKELSERVQKRFCWRYLLQSINLRHVKLTDSGLELQVVVLL